MSEAGNFLIYCVERYKAAKHLSGQEVAALFNAYDVWEYIYDCIAALHTTGEQYIINDIDGYNAEQNASA